MVDIDSKVTIELSINDISLIHQALTEWRSVAPPHVKADGGRLARWLEHRILFDDVRIKMLNKFTEILADAC